MDKKFFDSFSLKLIALITMTIDHVGAYIFPQYIIFRYIGRLSFPIFAFLIAEGYLHTKNVHRYLFNLGIFSVVSQVPYSYTKFGLLYSLDSINIFPTLFLGLLTIYLVDMLLQKQSYVLVLLVSFASIYGAEKIHLMYGYAGICTILAFYEFLVSEDNKIKLLSLIVFAVVNTGTVQIASLLALIPIYFYNGKRGTNIKYFFYIYYPLHLLIIGLIKNI